MNFILLINYPYLVAGDVVNAMEYELDPGVFKSVMESQGMTQVRSESLSYLLSSRDSDSFRDNIEL